MERLIICILVTDQVTGQAEVNHCNDEKKWKMKKSTNTHEDFRKLNNKTHIKLSDKNKLQDPRPPTIFDVRNSHRTLSDVGGEDDLLKGAHRQYSR